MIDAVATVMTGDGVSEAAKDGYAQVSGIARGTPGFAYLEIRPERIQVWKGQAEFKDRTVMRSGVWLDELPG